MIIEKTLQVIQEFKQIYFDEYHIELSDQEAAEKATAMLQLFDVLTTKEKGVL